MQRLEYYPVIGRRCVAENGVPIVDVDRLTAGAHAALRRDC